MEIVLEKYKTVLIPYGLKNADRFGKVYFLIVFVWNQDEEKLTSERIPMVKKVHQDGESAVSVWKPYEKRFGNICFRIISIGE